VIVSQQIQQCEGMLEGLTLLEIAAKLAVGSVAAVRNDVI
jgi:hypothetical protein